MNPQDRADHWRAYRRVLLAELVLVIGAPLALHIVLTLF